MRFLVYLLPFVAVFAGASHALAFDSDGPSPALDVRSEAACTTKPVSPVPSGLRCRAEGSLSKPKVISTSTQTSAGKCAKSCLKVSTCTSFSFQTSDKSCNLYTNQLKKGFHPKTTGVFFWSRNCYVVTCPSSSGTTTTITVTSTAPGGSGTTQTQTVTTTITKGRGKKTITQSATTTTTATQTQTSTTTVSKGKSLKTITQSITQTVTATTTKAKKPKTIIQSATVTTTLAAQTVTSTQPAQTITATTTKVKNAKTVTQSTTITQSTTVTSTQAANTVTATTTKIKNAKTVTQSTTITQSTTVTSTQAANTVTQSATVTTTSVSTASTTVTTTATTTAAAPTLGGFTNTGCFQGQILPGDVHFISNYMTLEACAGFCTRYSYFAVNFGNWCSCANTGVSQPAQNQCNFACSGDATETCGGNNALNLYHKGS